MDLVGSGNIWHPEAGVFFSAKVKNEVLSKKADANNCVYKSFHFVTVNKKLTATHEMRIGAATGYPVLSVLQILLQIPIVVFVRTNHNQL